MKKKGFKKKRKKQLQLKLQELNVKKKIESLKRNDYDWKLRPKKKNLD